MAIRLLLLLGIILTGYCTTFTFPEGGATYYLTKSGNDSNTCVQAQTESTAKLTFASAKTCLTAGDTLIVGDGTYNEVFTTSGMALGTAGARITVTAQNYRQAIFAVTGNTEVRGVFITIPYLTIQNIDFDCIGLALSNSNCLGASGTTADTTGIWLIGNKFHDSQGGGLLVGARTNWRIEENEVSYNGRSTTYKQSNGMYLTLIQNTIVRRNYVHHNECVGIRVGNSGTGTEIPTDNIIEYNHIEDNGNGYGGVDACSSDHGGIFVGGQRNIVRYNTIRHVARDGIYLYRFAGTEADNQVYNNTIYDVSQYALRVENVHSGAIVRNNIALGGLLGNLLDQGVGTTLSTNKTTGTITDCTVSTTDLRLKSGTNTCREGGTAIAGTSVVGLTDIGAYEQGSVASAVVASTFIEVTISTKNNGVLPTSGLTGFTIANGTSTGTPVVDSATVKAGSTNVIQLTTSGFTGSGTCTVSFTPGNMTDATIIGDAAGTAQLVNSVSGVSVSGTCNNSAGGAPPATVHIHHNMDEGTGTNLNDETANNLDSTLSGSPTWTTDSISGNAVAFASGVDQRATFQWGNGVNATSQSFSFCAWVKPIVGMGNKIVMGPSNGTNMRMYFGSWDGQTWQLGVGSSGQSATQSEFPVTLAYTRICVINDATTDTTTLAVNGVKGTSAAAVKSSASVTSLASNLLIGCGHFSGTSLCGGVTVDEPKVWLSALSDAELLEDFQSYTPPGTSVACYGQKAHRWQRVYTTGVGGSPISISTATEISVIAGGSVAVEMQLDCTGSAGSPLAVQLHATTSGGATGAVPQLMGALGISLHPSSAEATINTGVSPCCITGALTPIDGITITDAGATNAVTLAQNSSTMFRWILTVSTTVNETYALTLKQDNGAALAVAAGTAPVIRVIPAQAGGGY